MYLTSQGVLLRKKLVSELLRPPYNSYAPLARLSFALKRHI